MMLDFVWYQVSQSVKKVKWLLPAAKIFETQSEFKGSQ